MTIGMTTGLQTGRHTDRHVWRRVDTDGDGQVCRRSSSVGLQFYSYLYSSAPCSEKLVK